MTFKDIFIVIVLLMHIGACVKFPQRTIQRQFETNTLIVSETKFSKLSVWLPPNFDPGKSYKLAVIFHGRGSNANEAYLSYFPVHPDNIICIGMNAPYPDTERPGGFSYFPYSFAEEETLNISAAEKVADTIQGAIVRVQSIYNIGESTAVIGFSQGATFAFYFAQKYPTIVSSLILGSGIYSEIIPSDASQGLIENKVRVNIFHGEDDKSVPLLESRNLARSFPQELLKTEYPRDLGHSIDAHFQNFILRTLP